MTSAFKANIPYVLQLAKDQKLVYDRVKDLLKPSHQVVLAYALTQPLEVLHKRVFKALKAMVPPVAQEERMKIAAIAYVSQVEIMFWSRREGRVYTKHNQQVFRGHLVRAYFISEIYFFA
jgi:hypothetical protein